MRTSSTALRFSAVLSLLVAGTPLLAQSVHTVDDSGGEDFLDIQSAVAAATDGDLILVKSGTYSLLTLDGRSLFIVADAGAAVSISSTEIKNVPANARIGLQGLQFSGAPALSLSSNAGPIFVEDCVLEGAGVPSFLPAPGAVVTDSDHVTFTNCTIEATTDSSSDSGMNISGSGVYLYDCAVSGAKGIDTLPGGNGCQISGGAVFAAGSTFTGGEGGDGIVTEPFLICTDGGNGGHGLSLSAGFDGAPTLTVRDCSFTGGPGGPPGDAGCVPGTSGNGTQILAGSVTNYPFPTRTLGLTSPVRSDELTTVTFEADAGTLAILLHSRDTFPLHVPFLQGVVLPDLTPLNYTFFGVIPGSGILNATGSVPVQPGTDFAAVYAQASYWTPSSGLILGTPRLAITLDASF